MLLGNQFKGSGSKRFMSFDTVLVAQPMDLAI